MAEVTTADLLRRIQAKPLDGEVWNEFCEKVAKTGDKVNASTLKVVADGLRCLAQAKKGRLALSARERSFFIQLSRSYSNPTLLKEIGLLYLKKVGLPQVAYDHLAQAKRLGVKDQTLDGLLGEAKEEVEKQRQKEEGKESGLRKCHARPWAAGLIHQTGKVVMTREKVAGISFTEDSLLDDGVEDFEEISPSSIPQDLQKALAMVSRELGKGYYRKAWTMVEFICNRELQNKVLCGSIWTYVGELFFRRGDFEEALEAYLKAKDSQPHEVVCWFNYGLTQHLLGDFDGALQSYTMADQVGHEHPKVWNNIGTLHFQMDRLDAAEKAFKHAVVIDAQYARAWDNLACILGAQDKLEPAAQACRRAVTLQKNFPEAWLKLGIILFHEEKFEEAEEAFDGAKGLSEVSAYALSYRAMIRAKAGDPQVAIDYMEEAEKVDPSCEISWIAWNEIGLSYALEEKVEQARKAYQNGLRKKPGAPEILFNLGMICLKEGDLNGAEIVLTQFVQVHQEGREGWEELGLLYERRQQLAEAIRCWEKLTQLEPKDPKGWQRLADSYEANGQRQEAEKARLHISSL